MKAKSILLLFPILFAAILIGSSLAFPAQASPNDPVTFTITQVTANTVEDQSPAVAIDDNGAVHIAYTQNGKTAYMTNASGSWITTTIGAENTEFNPSIAIDKTGKVHISYFGGKGVTDPLYAIYYATNASGTWMLDYVTSFTDMNTCHSTGGIAVDDAGIPYITYATYDGSRYQIEMRYYDNSRLHSVTSGWTTGFSTSRSDHNHPSIDVEGDGTVHLAYQTYSMTDSTWDLEYATNASSSWITTTIPGAAHKSEESPSIAVDEQGKAHIAYINFDIAGYEAKYASNASGSWTTETVIDDNLIINDRPAITLDNKGQIHVALWSYNTSYYITHATNASGSWATMGMNVTDADLTEMDRAIAVDQNGYVHIVHSAPAGGDSEIYHAKSDESFGAAEDGTCTLPRTITCGEQVAGDTTGLSNNISSYGCNAWDESGPEEIWAFTLAPGTLYSVTAELLGISADLDIYLLDAGGCDAGTCLGPNSYGDWSASVDSLLGGNTYYIAVDGFAGAQGSYTMQLNCEVLIGPNLPVTPYSPQPTDGATNVSTNPILSWMTGDADGDIITGTVYGSTSSPPLIEPGNLWCSDSDQGNPVTQTCTAPNLSPNTTYYWRVEAFDGGESVDGPVWSFTTGTSSGYRIFLPLIIR